MRMFRSVRHRLHGWCGFDRAIHRVVGARPAATMRRRAHATVSASDSPPPRQRSDDITTWETRGTPARGLLQATGTSRSHGDESTTTTTRRTYALEQGDAHRAVAMLALVKRFNDAKDGERSGIALTLEPLSVVVETPVGSVRGYRGSGVPRMGVWRLRVWTAGPCRVGKRLRRKLRAWVTPWLS